MSIPLALTIACSAALLVLLLAIVRDSARGRHASKPLASLAFILVAISGGALDAGAPYPIWIVVGLILGAIGDVALMLPGSRAFMTGLVAFLLGHIAYLVAFHHVLEVSAWLTPIALVPAGAAVLVFAWLRPHLGSMRIPVAAYVVVITAMVVGALAILVASEPSLPERATHFLALGAILFFLSDLAVARQRFVRDSKVNRLLGLPAYYAGQLLLAWSAVLA